MMTAWMMLLIHSVWFPLRMGNTGSFPRPLKPEEEKMCLERMAQGDMEARNELIEHNLRLVAHIINNEESERKILLVKKRPYTGRQISGKVPNKLSRG